MDEIINFEDNYGGTIKVKRIIKKTPLNDVEVWQIYDIDTRRWIGIKHERIIAFYKLHLVQNRKVLIEKV